MTHILMHKVRGVLSAAVTIVGLMAAPVHASGNAVTGFPSSPVKVIVPYGPGGAIDTMARLVSQRLGESWGSSVVVENRPGANTNIGMRAVLASPADGYTFVTCTQSSHGSNPKLYSSTPYDAQRDFKPVAALAEFTIFMIVRADSPYQSFQALLDKARSQPGKLSYGSIGVGSLHHLAAEVIRQQYGADLMHVPYKSGGDLQTGLLGGQVDAMFHATPLALEKSGRVRILATTTGRRWPLAPEFPTVAEVVKGPFDIKGWIALCARSGTPDAIIEKVSRDVAAALKDPALIRSANEAGLHVLSGSTAEANRLIETELRFWGDFASRTKLNLD